MERPFNQGKGGIIHGGRRVDGGGLHCVPNRRAWLGCKSRKKSVASTQQSIAFRAVVGNDGKYLRQRASDSDYSWIKIVIQDNWNQAIKEEICTDNKSKSWIELIHEITLRRPDRRLFVFSDSSGNNKRCSAVKSWAHTLRRGATRATRYHPSFVGGLKNTASRVEGGTHEVTRGPRTICRFWPKIPFLEPGSIVD